MDDGRRATGCDACGHEWLRDPAPEWRPPVPDLRQSEPAWGQPLAQIETVEIWRLDRDSIRQRAMARAQTYCEWGHVADWDALLAWNEMGVRGEDAVAWYLGRLGHEVRTIAEDWIGTGTPDLGDLRVSVAADSPDRGASWNIEVKTDSPTKFHSRGPRRIDRCRAEIAVWCTSPGDENARWVQIQGWALIGVTGEAEAIRSIDDLDGWLRRPLG